MNDYLANRRELAREFHKHALTTHVTGLNRWQLMRAAFNYFGDSERVLAFHIAERLAGKPNEIREFLTRFPIRNRALARISKELLEKSL